jgi:hypothetical protein
LPHVSGISIGRHTRPLALALLFGIAILSLCASHGRTAHSAIGVPCPAGLQDGYLDRDLSGESFACLGFEPPE